MASYDFKEQYYNKGENLEYYQAHPSECISILKQAANGSYPELRGRARFCLGMIYLNDEPETAESHFESAIYNGDDSAYFYLGVLKLKRGSYRGIDDICELLCKAEIYADKAAEALYIIKKWLIKTGNRKELSALDDRLCKLWENSGSYKRSEGQWFLRRAYMALYDIVPEEADRTLFPSGKPTGKAGETARADLFRYFQKNAYKNGENFGNSVVESTISRANLAELDAYVSGRQGTNLDMTDRYSGWDKNRPKKSLGEKFNHLITQIPANIGLSIFITVIVQGILLFNDYCDASVDAAVENTGYAESLIFKEVLLNRLGRVPMFFLCTLGVLLLLSLWTDN